MGSLSTLNKRHSEKKKSVSVVKKKSGGAGPSPALTGKPKQKSVAGKAKALPKKKEAPKATAKPTRKPAPPSPAKKKPAKARPAAKAAQPLKKKETPKATAKPTRKPAPPSPAKKKPAKSRPAVKAAQPVKKKETPKATFKPATRPAPPSVAKKQSVKAKPAAKAVEPPGKLKAPEVSGEAWEKRAPYPEKDQPPAEKKVVVFEKAQTRNVVVYPADLGKRYKCYKCGIKFYDLGKPQPLCPSCGANQQDGVTKGSRKRKGKHRAAFTAKTEPLTVPPVEGEELHEVVDELDAEFVLDVDDIVLDDHQYTQDKD